MKKEIKFDKAYYNSIMTEFGYNPLEFEKINFSLGKLDKNDLQRRWLQCWYENAYKHAKMITLERNKERIRPQDIVKTLIMVRVYGNILEFLKWRI